MPATAGVTDEAFEDLCTGGSVNGLPRTLREAAQRVAAADQEHRTQMATLLALHERMLSRSADGAPPSAEEIAVLRLAEQRVVAAAEQRVAIAEETLAACRETQARVAGGHAAS